MTYLSLAFSKERCELKEYTASERLLRKRELMFTSQTIEVQLNQLLNVIQTEKVVYDGILLENFLVKELAVTSFETAKGEVISVTQYIAEALNCPVILTTTSETWQTKLELLAIAEEKLVWQLDYEGYLPGKSNYSVESLLTTGNGYLGLRGTLPEMEISEAHYPATYLAGLYNGATSQVEGQDVVNEDFVNAPNLQYLSLKIDDGAVISLDNVTINSLHRQLNLQDGLFQSELVVTDKEKRQVAIKTQRVVNMADKHHYALRYEFTPLNFDGVITIVSKSDASVYNFNVERYRSLEQHHLIIEDLQGVDAETIVKVRTKQSNIQVVQHSQLYGELITRNNVTSFIKDQEIVQELRIQAQKGQTYLIEKGVSVYRSQPNEETKVPQDRPLTKDFATNYQESQQAWSELWEQAGIRVTGDYMSQKLLNLHTYHLLVSGSPFSNQDLDVSITARGLHGEAYRGHIFWDEIFIMPFYTLHFPEMAKELLMYRYNRLDAAKQNAVEAGYTGAMFPWQSGLDGTEQTQELHLNPLNGQWGEDYSRLQRHVSLAIGYNVWLYWNNTGDRSFMTTYGAELMLEIAEFWRSKTEWDETTGRYSISKVMGPDEFHEAYPDSQTGGLTDNAYTNMMVVWLFEEIANLTELLTHDEFQDLQSKTGVTASKLAEMNQIRRKLRLEIDATGIIAQYAGYFDLKEIDWDYYRQKYGNVYRMDRILKANGESADDYKVAKQADTLMTFYNFSKVKVDRILADLSYQLPADYLEKNLEYYLKRTSHGSTLSRIVHAQLAENVGQRELAWQLYQEALGSDYRDIQGGTTAEGIHTGVMAATLYVTLATYGGLEIREDQLAINPNLPANWQGLAFKLKRQGIEFQFVLDRHQLTVKASQATKLTICQKEYSLIKDQQISVNYHTTEKGLASVTN